MQALLFFYCNCCFAEFNIPCEAADSRRGEGLVVETSILVSLILFLSLSIYLERTNQRNEMKQGRDKKPSFTLCWSLGMFVGIILGTAIGQLAVGIALGGMLGIMYHLLFAKPNHTKNDDEER